jgi:hypothetical protein
MNGVYDEIRIMGDSSTSTETGAATEMGFPQPYTVTLTLSFKPYQTFIFLEILFKNRNQDKILRKKLTKNLFFFQNPQK